MPTAIFEAVLGNLAVASALAVVAFAAGRWANRPALAHALWLLVLVKLLTPPLVTIPVRCLPAKVEPAPAPPPMPTPTEPSPVVIVEPVSPTASVPTQSAPVAPPASAPELPAATTPLAAGSTASWMPSWEVALLGVWVAGAVVSLVVAARRVRRFGRLLKFASVASPDFAEE